jgi:hypothetical protein
MDNLETNQLARLILVPGELERWAKDHGATPMSSRKQSQRQIDALRNNDTEISYVIQFSKKHAKDLKALDALVLLYLNVLHPIANSFHCQFGLEFVHLPNNGETIWDPDDIPEEGLDDAYIVNTMNEKYDDTLSFQFRVITRVDMVNMLSRVKDFNVHRVTPSKNLATYLKEQKIYLTLIWKSPPEFEEVASMVGPTPHTKARTVYEEIDTWLKRIHDIVLNPGSFKARIRELPKKEGGDQEMLVILSDPSVHKI